MGKADADYLQKLIEQQQTLATTHERMVQRLVDEYSAIRESDHAALKRYMPSWSDQERHLVPDPIGERIAEAFADFLWGEDPTILPASTKLDQETQEDEDQEDATLRTPTGQGDNQESGEIEPDEETAAIGEILDPDLTTDDDEDRLDDLVSANQLPTELHEAEMVCTSEGEVWWRIYKDTEQSEWPVVEWHSRSHVRPLFRGRRLIAAALVSDLYVETVNDEVVTWKYVQIQTEGYVRNLLYRGTNQQLGASMPLNMREETATLQEEWEHGLGMLCGRIHNRLGKDRRFGISVFKGVKELLYSLHEATTIGHENARLTLKKRVAVPREAIKDDGTFAAGEDVLVTDSPLDTELGGAGPSGQFAVLEYSFDAAALIAYKNDLSSTILTRVGLARQVTDPNNADGQAASGTALRVRLIPTTMSVKGKARVWDDELPRILMLAQQLDALPEERGGFGRKWQKPGEPPVVERADPLPIDETEETNRHAVAVSGEFESRFTAIKDLHPDWDDEQVTEELNRIYGELQTMSQLAAPPPPDVTSGALAPPGQGEGGVTPPPAEAEGSADAGQPGSGEQLRPSETG